MKKIFKSKKNNNFLKKIIFLLLISFFSDYFLSKINYFKNKQCENCDTLASYELIETIIYKDILSQKEDKYYITGRYEGEL